MKKSTAHYLLAAVANNEGRVAINQEDAYETLLLFAKRAYRAATVAELCEGEGECDRNLLRRVKRAACESTDWIDNAFDKAFHGLPYVVDETSKRRKEHFDSFYRQMYRREPPNLAEP